MKKLALLLVLTFVLSLSCAFATDEAPILIAPNPAATSGELSGEDTVTLPEEGTTDLSGEVTEPAASGEQTPSDTDTTPNTPSTDTDNTNNDKVKSSNTSVVGAIIAIAIVIAVVVVAAIIRKD